MLDLLTVTYLFLGGAGAGACVVLAVLSAACPRSGSGSASPRFSLTLAHRRLFGSGFAVAAATSFAGALCLYLDLARPDALVVLLTSPSYNVVSVGAYSLAVLLVCLVVLTLVCSRTLRVSTAFVRVVMVVSVIAAFVVMAYTALLLRSFGHRPFLQSPMLVALFVLSSVSTGSALVVLSTMAFGSALTFRAVVARALRIDAAVIVAEFAALVVFLLASVPAAPGSVLLLLAGEFAPVFWVGFVGCGLAAPCALEFAMDRVPGLQVQPFVPAAMVLVGGFLLRWCIVAAAAGGVG